MIKIGIVGLGFMGQMHFNCFKNNPNAEIVVVGDLNANKLSGNPQVTGNIASTEPIDLSGVRTTTDIRSLASDPEIDLLDICLPTRAHAEFAVEALQAGKHVLCEKPMGFDLAECDAMMAAQQKSGKVLFIGHCLRFWPQYVKAYELMQSGVLGEVQYARLFRISGAPTWSRWLMKGQESGGALLDLHLHDIDTALWWFGQPDEVQTSGWMRDNLPLKVDASWKYHDGPQLHLHGGWDPNGINFSMGFDITGNKATLSWDSSKSETMQLFQQGQTTEIEVENVMGYQAELDYLIECLETGTQPTRVTPESSRLSVELAQEELRQLGFKAA